MARGRRSDGNKLLGEGWICTVLLRKLHPQDIIGQKFPNAIASDRLSDLVTVKQGKGHRHGGGVTKVAIFFTTASIPDIELWAASGFTKVITSCDPSKTFTPAPAPTIVPPAAAQVLEDSAVDLGDFHRTNNINEDIARVLEMGLMVDDDRQPAEENVPSHRNKFLT
jgi:hypothetical protein